MFSLTIFGFQNEIRNMKKRNSYFPRENPQWISLSAVFGIHGEEGIRDQKLHGCQGSTCINLFWQMFILHFKKNLDQLFSTTALCHTGVLQMVRMCAMGVPCSKTCGWNSNCPASWHISKNGLSLSYWDRTFLNQSVVLVDPKGRLKTKQKNLCIKRCTFFSGGGVLSQKKLPLSCVQDENKILFKGKYWLLSMGPDNGN